MTPCKGRVNANHYFPKDDAVHHRFATFGGLEVKAAGTHTGVAPLGQKQHL